MTVNELRVLNEAMSDLAGGLQARRAFRQRDREQRRREELDAAMLGLREQEQAGQREDRQATRAQQAAEAADLSRHRADTLAAQREHYGQLERSQTQARNDAQGNAQLRVLAEMAQNGMLTEEALGAMEKKFGEMLGGAGVGVKLFKLPPAKRAPWEEGTREITDIDPVTGEEKTRRIRTLPPGAKVESTPASPPTAAAEPPKPGVGERLQSLADKPVLRTLAGMGTLGASELPRLIMSDLRREQPRAGLESSPAAIQMTNDLTAGLPAPAAPAAPAGPAADAAAIRKPTGKTDAELFADARAKIKQRPELRKNVEDLLRAWGIDPTGL